MKKNVFAVLAIASAVALQTGCSWSVGSGQRTGTIVPTTGQQLMDLKKARDTGAISDAEFEAQKAKLLGHK